MMPPILAAVAIALVTGIMFLAIRYRVRYQVSNEPAWLRQATERELRRRAPKWATGAAVAGGVMFFAGIGMFLSAFSSNPRQPDPPSGHVYQLNNHGSYVYITKADYIRIFGTTFGGWSVSAASIVVGYQIARRRVREAMGTTR